MHNCDMACGDFHHVITHYQTFDISTLHYFFFSFLLGFTKSFRIERGALFTFTILYTTALLSSVRASDPITYRSILGSTGAKQLEPRWQRAMRLFACVRRRRTRELLGGFATFHGVAPPNCTVGCRTNVLSKPYGCVESSRVSGTVEANASPRPHELFRISDHELMFPGSVLLLSLLTDSG